MTDPVPLDRLRDLLDGRLSAAEAESLRGAIASDPALRADFETLRFVHGMTAAEARPPASRVTWNDVAPGGRVLRLRPAAAASIVAVGLALGVAASLLRAPGPFDVVELSVLRVPRENSVSAVACFPASAPVPPGLGDYTPVRDGRVNWITTWDAGRELARAARKPIFLYLFHPTCPWCQELDSETFTDAGAQADLAEFVLVRVDVMSAPAEVSRRAETGWPYLAALDADGREVRSLAGLHTLAEMRPALDGAAEAARGLGPTWAQVRESVAAWDRASEAERAGRLGDAWTSARAAADAARGSAPGFAGADLAVRLVARASSVLADARSAAADDPDAAAAAVEAAASAFEGSAPGADLDAVARALRGARAFPELRERTR